MKEITQKIINDELPVHDSDFLEYKIIQENSGETQLALKIAFCEGEFEHLQQDFTSIIRPNGAASFVFKNCWWVNINIICNTTKRDAVDYIKFIKNSSKLKGYDLGEDFNHVEVVFVSGSRLECIAENVVLT